MSCIALECYSNRTSRRLIVLAWYGLPLSRRYACNRYTSDSPAILVSGLSSIARCCTACCGRRFARYGCAWLRLVRRGVRSVSASCLRLAWGWVGVWSLAVSSVNLLHENHSINYRFRRTNSSAMLPMVLEYIPAISRLAMLQSQ